MTSDNIRSDRETDLLDPSSIPELVDSYWTRERTNLRDWMARNAPGLCEVYAGAVELLYGQEISGLIRFVAHAVREIQAALPRIITGEKFPRFEWKNRLDDLSKIWFASGPTEVELTPRPLPSQDEKIPVAFLAVRKVDAVLREYQATRESHREAATRFIESRNPRATPGQLPIGPLVNHWLEVCKWGWEYAHVPDHGNPQLSRVELQEHFQEVELALIGLLAEFFTAVEGIDEILEQANS